MSRLADDHAHCDDLLRGSRSSFALPIRLLPVEKRRATTALYAFCRRVDDIVDGTGGVGVDPTAAAVALDAIAADLDAALAGGRSADPVIRALSDSVARYSIPPRYLHEVIEGVRMDLAPAPIPDVDALERYCSRVASAVGLAAIHIWGFTSPAAIPAGHACGLAFQLTNILRDIPEDLERGRIYIPESDFLAAGCSPGELSRGADGAAFRRLATIEVARADGYYRRARRLDSLLSTDGRIVFRAMYGAYRTIFHAVRKAGSRIFSAPVSPPKPLLAAAALAAVATGPRGLGRPW